MSYSDSAIYHPEMGEKADMSKLFQSHYVYNCYGIEWKEEDNAKALEVFKSLRIRLKKRNSLGETTETRTHKDGSKWVVALVTFAAHDKLMNSGNICLECLLD